MYVTESLRNYIITPFFLSLCFKKNINKCIFFADFIDKTLYNTKRKTEERIFDK